MFSPPPLSSTPASLTTFHSALAHLPDRRPSVPLLAGATPAFAARQRLSHFARVVKFPSGSAGLLIVEFARLVHSPSPPSWTLELARTLCSSLDRLPDR